MNLVTHIFKKDIRHLRGLLIAWFLLVLLQVGLSGSGLAASSDNMAWEIAFGIVSVLIPMLQFMLILAIVPLLIHEEPLVGTTAFWFTRPISRQDLLKSKALFCGGLLVLIPLVVELVVLAANQASCAQLAMAFPEILLSRLGVLLMVAALAVLTPSFARFVLFAVLVFVAYMIVYFVIYIVILFVNPMAMVRMAGSPSLMASRAIVSAFVGVIGYGAVVFYQYIRRRTKRSALLLAGVVILAMAMPYLWQFDFMEAEIDPHLSVNVDESNIRVSLADKKIKVSDQFRMSGREGRKKTLRGRIRVQGGEPGFEYRSQVDSSAFTFEDGLQITNSQPQHSFSRGGWDNALLGNLLDGRIRGRGNVSSRQESYSTLLDMDEADYTQQTNRVGTLEAEIQIGVYQYVVAGMVPLQAGERIELGAEQAVITDVLEDATGCSVILQVRTLNLLFDKSAKRENQFNQNSADVLYLLRNPVKKELVLPDTNFNPNFGMIFGKNQRLNIQSIRLKFGEEGRGRELSPEWLADAELIRVEAVKVDQFSKELSEEVRLDASSSSYSTSRKSKEEVAAELDKISLPENPTKEDVRAYIRAIDQASKGSCRRGSNDRQVAMYQAIGPEHLDLLFEEIPHSYYLKFAVPALIEDSHKPWVIENLSTYPWLVNVVWKNGWSEDARPELIQGLKKYSEDLPAEWIKAVASFEDPKTYDSLMDCFVNQGNRAQTYKVIRKLDGIQLENAVARAWKRAKYEQEYETNTMIPIAIAYGHQDALRLGIVDILGGDSDRHRQEVRKAVKKHTGIDGSDEELVAWFAENGDHLTFNKEIGLFQVVDIP